MAKKINLDSDFDPNSEQITGPINVARLEGTVGSVKKVIYLFMDFHMEVYEQTKCSNVYSQNISKYLANGFNSLGKSPKFYDFFYEEKPSDIVPQLNSSQRAKYIGNVGNFFSKIYSYDKEHNKTLQSHIYKNVRLHYLDIRDHLINKAYNMYWIYNACTDLWYNFSVYTINNIIEWQKISLDHINNIYKILILPDIKSTGKKNPVIATFNSDANLDIVTDFTYKIREKYNHPHIKISINKDLDYLTDKLKKFIVDFEASINRFVEIREKMVGEYTKASFTDGKFVRYGIKPNVIRSLINEMCDFSDKHLEGMTLIFAGITDLFMLRRFLDKDYITNAIVYTGEAHSSKYIRLLISKFGFKITHISYSSISDMEKLNDTIKKRVDKNIDDQIDDLLLAPYLLQCSDISSFPKNFS